MRDLSIYEEDYRLDDTSAGAFETISKSLPHAVTVGSTLVIDGRPQFKDMPKILCPSCGHELKQGKSTIAFRYAPAHQSEQSVEALVCNCGEAYVSGEEARIAYHRAMQTTEVMAAQELGLADFANELRSLSAFELHALWRMQDVGADRQDAVVVQKREAIRREAARRRAELELTEWIVDEIIADSALRAKS